MFIPGFDPKSMSEDELLKRSNDISRRIGWTQRYSGSGQGISQLSMMLSLLENERAERMFMEQWNQVSDYASEVIETDPDLRDMARAAKEKKQPEKTNSRPRVAVRRPYPLPTPQPVVPK